jgi:hypothetical protein
VRGNPNRSMRRPKACLASTVSGGLGFPPGPQGSATVCWLDGDRRAARNRQEPSPRKSGPGSLRRRGGAPGGVAACLCFPAIREIRRGVLQCAFRRSASPHLEGRKLKAHLAWRRENAGAWLFEIRIGNTKRGVSFTSPRSSRGEVGAQRRVRGQALRRKAKNLSGRKASTRRHDPRVHRPHLAHCLAPHPKPSLRFGFDLSPRKSGER